MILLLTILFLYLLGFLGIQIVKFKLRKFQRKAEEYANQERTQYADGQITYNKNDKPKKHFSQSDGEYVDYEEVK